MPHVVIHRAVQMTRIVYVHMMTLVGLVHVMRVMTLRVTWIVGIRPAQKSSLTVHVRLELSSAKFILFQF